jgi:hypothetical protein
MTRELADTSDGRYGPLGFAVALVQILIVDLATWLFVFPVWPMVIYVLPVLLVYAALCALIARGPGKVGQIGRGMLFGSLSGPLSILIFFPAFIIAHAIGPI